MLALTGIALLFLSGVLFQWTLRHGKYRRYPFEQFALVGASAAIGFATVLTRPNVVHWVLFLVELVTLAGLTWYISIGARFSRGETSLKLGEPFPSFTLQDSRGGTFDSKSLQGLDGKTALYLFYRGPW
ncbi:MAG: hypothetical protein E2P02_17605 [Acidobacteria bacterium]|nr:MAG: hypothetical protein E2P02_17605 [Acidobacteriota bacterium]